MKNIIVLALALLAAQLLAEHTYPANPDPSHAEFFGKLGRDNLVITNAPVNGEARVLPKYLHAISFADSYPAEAAWYYRTFGAAASARCSSVRDGNSYSRNYDWPFTDAAEFVIGMAAGPNRFASVGVASVGTNLTESMVASRVESPFFKCLPGATLDGINENGVVCNINVASGEVSGWHGSSLHPLAAVRWVLDNATNAEHAATYLADNIGFPDGWSMNFHFMVADKTSTYIIENGEAHEVTGRAVMTNFKLYPTRDTSGEGQERFDILAAGADITNAWYSLAYLRGTSPVRVSDIGMDTNAVFTAWESKPREEHRGEVLPSGKVWWQSVHTSVYDIEGRTLRLAVQETDDWYVFAVPVSGRVDAYTKAETDVRLSQKRDIFDRHVWELSATGFTYRVERDIGGILASFRNCTPKFVTASGMWVLLGWNNDDWYWESVSGQGESANPIAFKFVDYNSEFEDGIIGYADKVFAPTTTKDFVDNTQVIPFTRSGNRYIISANEVSVRNGSTDVGGVAGMLNIVEHDDSQSAHSALFARKANVADVTRKADKVVGAITGSVAALDANGNLVNGGILTNDIRVISDLGVYREYCRSTWSGEMFTSTVQEDEFFWVLKSPGFTDSYMRFNAEQSAYQVAPDRSFDVFFQSATATADATSISFSNPRQMTFTRTWGENARVKVDDIAKASDIHPPANYAAVSNAAMNAVSRSAVTNIVDARVSANLNTFIDTKTGIEYVGKYWNDNLYYVPTGNVYPPNN